MTGVETVQVDHYEPDGTTHVDTLVNARGVQWQRQFNAAGWATFEVPLEDSTTAAIGDRSIVKFTRYRDGTPVARFACRIRSESCELAKDGRRWVRFEQQPGLLSLLGDAVIFPEYGYVGVEEVVTGVNRLFATLQTGSERWFGYMSAAGGAWYITGDWGTPLATAWNTTGTYHDHQPPEFATVDTAAYWISATDPDTSQPSQTVNYFRSSFTTTGAQQVQITAAGDDYLDLFVDGEPVITADRTQHNQWHAATQVTVRVSDGAHVIAARVANAPFVTGHLNPVAFICAVHLLDPDGTPTTLLLDTNTSDWVVNDGSSEPGWTRANLLHRLFAEAAARSVEGVNRLALGFTDTDDSNSDPWDGADRGQFTLSLLSANLADVAVQLTEPGGFDLDVDPTTMAIQAVPRIGTDRTASVTLSLGDAGGFLKSWKASKHGTRFTSAVAQMSDGSFVIADNDAGITASGRIESGVSLGTVDSVKAAHLVMGGLLDEAATPLVAVTGETSLLGGPIPDVDFFLGDTVLGRNERNTGTVPVRIMSLTYDFTGDRLTVVPEYVVDPSA